MFYFVVVIDFFFMYLTLVATIPKYNDLKEGPQYLENKICIFVNVETRR
jgi:hypothetical protein